MTVYFHNKYLSIDVSLKVIVVVTSGNVQQHRDLHRGPRRRGRAQPQRDAHLPVRECQRQRRRRGFKGVQAGTLQVCFLLKCIFVRANLNFVCVLELQTNPHKYLQMT